MTADNISSITEELIEKSLLNIKNRSNNFHIIPPIIGIILSDQFGNTIMVSEYKSNGKENYNPIKKYLSEDDANLIDIDLISMYFSSFKMFAGETNIKNLSHLEIHGSNIKVQIYFKFEDFIIIIFLNSHTILDSNEKSMIINYFEDIFSKFGESLKNYNSLESKETIHKVAKKGTAFLKTLNKKFLQRHNQMYLNNYEHVERLSKKILPVIHNEINEYFKNIEEDLLYNLNREIDNKIQDIIFQSLSKSEP